MGHGVQSRTTGWLTELSDVEGGQDRVLHTCMGVGKGLSEIRASWGHLAEPRNRPGRLFPDPVFHASCSSTLCPRSTGRRLGALPARRPTPGTSALPALTVPSAARLFSSPAPLPRAAGGKGGRQAPPSVPFCGDGAGLPSCCWDLLRLSRARPLPFLPLLPGGREPFASWTSLLLAAQSPGRPLPDTHPWLLMATQWAQLSAAGVSLGQHRAQRGNEGGRQSAVIWDVDWPALFRRLLSQKGLLCRHLMWRPEQVALHITLRRPKGLFSGICSGLSQLWY